MHTTNYYKLYYAFYLGKGCLLKKIWTNRGEGGRPQRPPPFKSATYNGWLLNIYSGVLYNSRA